MESKDSTYLSKLASFITENRVRMESFFAFWQNVCETMDQLLLNVEMESIEEKLLYAAEVDSKYAPSITKLKSVFDKYLPTFYTYRNLPKHHAHDTSKTKGPTSLAAETQCAITMAFEQPNRNVFTYQIDQILKQNLRQDSKVSGCTRCGHKTQTSITLDGLLNGWQNQPPWLDTYLDACFCGGLWVPN